MENGTAVKLGAEIGSGLVVAAGRDTAKDDV